MTRFSKSILLLGTAVLTVATACAGSKGPGAIGTKEDIVVRNNGLPSEPKAPPPGADVPESGLQGAGDALAMPPAAVEQAEPLPDTSPAVEQAVEAQQESVAPVPPPTAEPLADPVTNTPVSPSEAAIPEQTVPQMETPVEQPPQVQQPAPALVETPAPVAPAPAPAPVPAQVPVTTAPPSSVYPAEDYPVQAIQQPSPQPVPEPIAAAPVPAPAPQAPSKEYVPLPAGSAYPLDPNAPYSPSAVAAANQGAQAAPVATPPSSAPAPAVPAPTSAPLNMADPVLIRSAQAALKAKGAYTGAESGQIDAAFLNALVVYQGQNGLPVGGMNVETLRHLGVIE